MSHKSVIDWNRNLFTNTEGFLEENIDIIPLGIAEETRKFHSQIPGYKLTPLHQLKNLSEELKIGGIWVKDESSRFELDSFKVLGGTFALYRHLLKVLGKIEMTFEELISSKTKNLLGEVTFAAATAGNHGKGIAWAARKLGQKAMIYVNKTTTKSRIEAIEKYGATVHVVNGTYEDSVHAIQEDATKNGWQIVADTAWDGYEQIPTWIMQGYTTLLAEAQEQLCEQGVPAPTHLFVQAGVGSFAAAAAGFYVGLLGKNAPKIIVVEPGDACCYLHSVRQKDGASHIFPGEPQSMMAGLACNEANPLAWKILKQCADVFLSCRDEVSAEAMKKYYFPEWNDPQVIAGESGAVTLGALMRIMKDSKYAELRNMLGLDKNSQVLLVNTEGATDIKNYKKIVCL